MRTHAAAYSYAWPSGFPPSPCGLSTCVGRSLPGAAHLPPCLPAHCRLEWGGSLMRPEATGFGAVYFAGELLADVGDSLKGKRCIVSGSG